MVKYLTYFTIAILLIFINILIGLVVRAFINDPDYLFSTTKKYNEMVYSCPLPEVKKMDCSIYIEELEANIKEHDQMEKQWVSCVKDLVRCQNENHIDCLCMEPNCE